MEGLGVVRKTITQAKRPLVLAGGGIRASGSYEAFKEFLIREGIPVCTAWNAHDLVMDDHPLYAGRPGSVGDRAGNFAVQTADVLLILGSRLNIRQISYNYKSFSPNAFKIMVDVDPQELRKKTLSNNFVVCMDLKDFFRDMPTPMDYPEEHRKFRARCHEWRKKYPVCLTEYRANPDGPVNPYVLMNNLFEMLPPGSKVVTGDGTACVTAFQAAIIKQGTRLYTNSGAASMGYGLPAAIGAAIGTGEKIICIEGDGSIMMNLQEIQTVRTNNLPIKIIILDNDGYHSIRQTQNNFFPGREVGCGPTSGLGFPNWYYLGDAFDIPVTTIYNLDQLNRWLKIFIEGDGPSILVVKIDKNQEFSPRLKSRRLDDGTMETPPLHDMWPFLSREDLALEMSVK